MIAIDPVHRMNLDDVPTSQTLRDWLDQIDDDRVPTTHLAITRVAPIAGDPRIAAILTEVCSVFSHVTFNGIVIRG